MTRAASHLVNVALVCTVLFYTSPGNAFRTASDLTEFNDTDVVRWASPTISYFRNTDLPSDLSPPLVQRALVASFRVWSDVNCTSMRFDDRGLTASPGAPDDGRSTIQWLTKGWSALGAPSDAPALTDIQYERDESGKWRIVEADLYLNAEFHAWTAGPGSEEERDLQTITLHEAGHMLGLLHPCEFGGLGGAPDCDAHEELAKIAMYPVYSTEQAELSEDDKAGVCFLYPSAGCDDDCAAGTQCVEGACTELCGSQICSATEHCVDERCQEFRIECDAGSCSECDRDDDCPAFLRCVQGQCRQPDGAYGDPCRTGRDCETGTCGTDDRCTRRCTSDGDCDDAAQCDAKTAQCIDPRKALGETCSSPDECRGDQCVTGVADEPLCTRACRTPDNPCPDDWECTLVDDESVCVPRVHIIMGGSSCSLSGSARRPSGGGPWAFVAALVILVAAMTSGRRNPWTWRIQR